MIIIIFFLIFQNDFMNWDFKIFFSIKEPLIYRLVEAMQHYGESIKIIVNEKLGDGIMSAIDLYLTVDSVKGVSGEDRVVVTMNGKYLPHIEQLASNNTANTF